MWSAERWERNGSAMGRIRIWAGLVALLASGCATGPAAPSMDFFTRVVFGFPALPPTAIPGTGAIQLTGLLVTRHSGYTISGALTSGDAASLIVTITATEDRVGAPFPTQNYYAATVNGLTAVPYDVRVIYIIHRDSRDSSEVLRQTITPNR